MLLFDAHSLLYTTYDRYKELLSNAVTEDGFISLLKPALDICNACDIDTTGAEKRQKKRSAAKTNC